MGVVLRDQQASDLIRVQDSVLSPFGCRDDRTLPQYRYPVPVTQEPTDMAAKTTKETKAKAKAAPKTTKAKAGAKASPKAKAGKK
mgnify:CR=1 FL=1